MSSHKMSFSAKTLQSRRVWDNIFKGLKLKNSQPRILYWQNTCFKNTREIKTFPEKQKLREFITRPALQEMLNGVLQGEHISCNILMLVHKSLLILV